MMPSVDRVGRHFPLMVAAPALPGTPLLDWVRKAAAWYDDLEDLARGSLESDFVLEQFDQQLFASEAAMPAPLPLSNRPAYAAWRLPMQERDQVPQGIAELLLQGHSLWWSDGSPSVEPSMLVCQGMPAPDAFAAMLDGRWQARGWGVARAG
jgi:type VI secretion system protein ImpM